MKAFLFVLLLASLALNTAFLTGCVTRERFFPNNGVPSAAAGGEKENAALVRIARQLDIPTDGKSFSDLENDIRSKLDHAENVPRAFPEGVFSEIRQILAPRDQEVFEDYQQFILQLQGKRVIAVGGDD